MRISMPRYTHSMCFATNVFPVNKNGVIKRKGTVILNQLNSNRSASFGYSCLLVSTIILETYIYPQVVLEVSVGLRTLRIKLVSPSSFPVHKLEIVKFVRACIAHHPALVNTNVFSLFIVKQNIPMGGSLEGPMFIDMKGKIKSLIIPLLVTLELLEGNISRSVHIGLCSKKGMTTVNLF